MTVHLLKLCVGAGHVSDLRSWIKRRSVENERAGRGCVHLHVTRMHPRRAAELLDGGSLYWVIKGIIQARQAILGFESCTGADGVNRCAISLKPEIVETEPQPRRAFQGWRYLPVEDAPPDLSAQFAEGAPPELRAKLAILGLL